MRKIIITHSKGIAKKERKKNPGHWQEVRLKYYFHNCNFLECKINKMNLHFWCKSHSTPPLLINFPIFVKQSRANTILEK